MPRQRPKERLIEELEKQYDVVRVDPNSPITERFDVLLAVQPSSLNPPADDELCRCGAQRRSRRRFLKIRCRSP